MEVASEQRTPVRKITNQYSQTHIPIICICSELTRSMQSLSLQERIEPLSTTDSHELGPERHKLPALDSSEWGFEELALPPPPRR